MTTYTEIISVRNSNTWTSFKSYQFYFVFHRRVMCKKTIKTWKFLQTNLTCFLRSKHANFFLTKTKNTFDSQIVYYSYVTNKKLCKGFRVTQGQKAAEIALILILTCFPLRGQITEQNACMHAKMGDTRKGACCEKIREGRERKK